MTESDFFEAMERERLEFDARVAKSPVVEVVGMVDLSGAARMRRAGEEHWTTVVHLVSWRFHDGEPRIDTLRVECPEVHDVEARLPPRAFVVATGRIATNARGDQQMQASSVRECEEIAELRTAGEALLTPRSISHPLLGSLTYDPKYAWFSGRVKAGRERVEVLLDAKNGGVPDEAEKTLAIILDDLAAFIDRARGYAADSLLELRNQTWRDPHEPPATRQAFTRALRKPQLLVHVGGRFTIYFEAGNLFWDHAVEVRGAPSGDFDEACISG